MKARLTKKEIGNRNLKLGMEFARYIVEHPDITDQIPEDGSIIIFPKDDPELCEINNRELRDRINKGEKVVIVKIERIKYQFEGLEINTAPKKLLRLSQTAYFTN